MATARIHPATAGDAEVLDALMREFYRELALRHEESASRAALEALLSDSTLGRVWLVHVGGETVGYAAVTFGFSLELHGRVGLLDEFYVALAHRGRGIGAAALAAVVEECRRLGLRSMVLEADEHDPRATSLYTRAGFAMRHFRMMAKPLASDQTGDS